MGNLEFSYHAVFKMGETSGPAAGLIVVERSQGPLRAVIWSHRRKAWTFNPRAAAPLLFDDQQYDQQTVISRPQAEEIARTLGTELPSEEELHRISEEGEASQG